MKENKECIAAYLLSPKQGALFAPNPHSHLQEACQMFQNMTVSGNSHFLQIFANYELLFVNGNQ